MASDQLNKNSERSRDIFYSPYDANPPVYINYIGGAYSVRRLNENSYRIFMYYTDAENYAKSLSTNVVKLCGYKQRGQRNA